MSEAEGGRGGVECPLPTHCRRLSQGYRASMSEDLRDSLRLWVGGLALMAAVWVALRLDLMKSLADRIPANWFWLGMGVLAIWNGAQLGWGLWQRRASNPDNPNLS